MRGASWSRCSRPPPARRRRHDEPGRKERCSRWSAATGSRSVPGSAARAGSSRRARRMPSVRSRRTAPSSASPSRSAGSRVAIPGARAALIPSRPRRRGSSLRFSAAPRATGRLLDCRHDRHPPHPALGHLHRLAVLPLGVVEPAQRPTDAVRAAAGASRRTVGDADADARRRSRRRPAALPPRPRRRPRRRPSPASRSRSRPI